MHLIVNERAGRGRGARAGQEAQEALLGRGARVVLHATGGPGDAVLLARKARQEGAAVVAAVGGDGTLHEVLNGLLGDALLRGAQDGPAPFLGAIPVGSGNDYVKMLGVSRQGPRAAALALLDGPSRLVDVGILEGAAPRGATEARPELFLNNLGLAFAGDANARIESTRGLPGFLAYTLGAALAFMNYDPPLTELELDGRVAHKGKPTLIHVNLGRYCGGGVLFTPDAELDDGLFDVLVLGEVTRIGAILRWRSITTGGGRTMADVTIDRAASVAVRGPAGRLLHADGEVRQFIGEEVRARVVPRVLHVITGGVTAATMASVSTSTRV